MKRRYQNDIENYGGEILQSQELRNAYNQTHHTWSTVGEHTIRVAVASLAICYALRKLHIRTDTSAVVKAALCHDLGILGRHEKYKTKKECSMQHPADSAEIARRLVKDLPEKSADIIERHMWPAGHSKAPNSLEGVIVSLADKYAAVKDLLLGSEIQHTGIKNKVHDFFSGEVRTG